MVVKKGYKQTEVGQIPNDWSAVPIGELLNFQGGSQPDKSFFRQTWKPGYIRLIQIRDYKTDQFITYIPRMLARRFCTTDDIMIGRYGPPIFQILRGIEGAYNVALIKAIVQPNVSKSFCYYFLKRDTLFHFIEKLSQRSSGQTGVDLGELRKYSIPLPPTLREQEAIAEALSDADAWIESLEQLIAKKRQIKQGAMQELLTGKRRLPGFSGQWETKRLGDLARLYQPTTISASSFTTFGFPVYGANGIVGFYHSCNHSTWQVTVTCRGSTCGTVNKTVDKCWITGNAMVLNCDHNHELDKSFLFHLLSKQDLTVCITGTGQPQIVRTPLAAVELRLPQKISEQQAIATILSDMDTEIESLESKLSKAREIKQGMMQELLTGKIRLVKSSAVSANPLELSDDR